jgi:hypothetical protein
MLAGSVLLPGTAAQVSPSLTTSTGIGVACQFDTAAYRDTAQFALSLSPPLFQQSAPPAAYTPYLLAVASTFEMPTRLTLGSWPGTFNDIEESCADSQWCQVGSWDGEVELTLTRAGRLEKLEWTLWPDSPETRSAVEAAIRRADSLALLPPTAKVRGFHSGRIRFGVRFSRDSAGSGALTLGRIRLPYIKVSRPVGVIQQPAPRWPDGVNRGEAIIQLQYIVAEDGRVSPETIRVLQADSRAFVAPSIQAILDSRFRAARSGPCPVQMLVRQRVRYQSR